MQHPIVEGKLIAYFDFRYTYVFRFKEASLQLTLAFQHEQTFFCLGSRYRLFKKKNDNPLYELCK